MIVIASFFLLGGLMGAWRRYNGLMVNSFKASNCWENALSGDDFADEGSGACCGHKTNDSTYILVPFPRSVFLVLLAFPPVTSPISLKGIAGAYCVAALSKGPWLNKNASKGASGDEVCGVKTSSHDTPAQQQNKAKELDSLTVVKCNFVRCRESRVRHKESRRNTFTQPFGHIFLRRNNGHNTSSATEQSFLLAGIIPLTRTRSRKMMKRQDGAGRKASNLCISNTWQFAHVPKKERSEQKESGMRYMSVMLITTSFYS